MILSWAAGSPSTFCRRDLITLNPWMESCQHLFVSDWSSSTDNTAAVFTCYVVYTKIPFARLCVIPLHPYAHVFAGRQSGCFFVFWLLWRMRPWASLSRRSFFPQKLRRFVFSHGMHKADISPLLTKTCFLGCFYCLLKEWYHDEHKVAPHSGFWFAPS